MKKRTLLLTLSALSIGALISCTQSPDDASKNTGATTDNPGNFGATPPGAGSGMRGTQSAAQLDSAKRAHEEYVSDTSKK